MYYCYYRLNFGFNKCFQSIQRSQGLDRAKKLFTIYFGVSIFPQLFNESLNNEFEHFSLFGKDNNSMVGMDKWMVVVSGKPAF